MPHRDRAAVVRGQYGPLAARGKGRGAATGPERAPRPRGATMRGIGRLGQFLGLALPALAILLELNHAISLGQMLMLLVAAVCCFGIGRILEGYAGS